MPTGSITDQDVKFVETWENIAVHQNAVIKLSPRGDERQEIISGTRQFMLTTEERIITESKIHSVKNNPFRNGSFRPVIVPDDLTIDNNPNALSDADIFKILASSDLAWSEWMSNIDSIATLRRMLDLCETAENVTLKRVREIEGRVVAVRQSNRLVTMRNGEEDKELAKFLNPGAGPSGQPGAGGRVVGERAPQRGVGGRSSDYR